MTDQEVLTRLSQILADLLGEPSVALTMETTREDVPGWDSFVYVNFIIGVEMDFGIKFGVADVESFETVGDVVQGIRTLIEE